MDEVREQAKIAIGDIHKKSNPPPKVEANVLADMMEASDGTKIVTGDKQTIEKSRITKEDIELIKNLMPGNGVWHNNVILAIQATGPQKKVATPAPVAAVQTDTDAPHEDPSPASLSQLVESASKAPAAAPTSAAAPASVAAAPAKSATPVKAVEAAAVAMPAVAMPVEAAAVTEKPREAIDFEKTIKDNEIKLRLVKARPLEILESEEATRASKLNKAAKGSNELNDIEEKRVQNDQDNLKKLIRKDQAKLQVVFSDSDRASYKEYKKEEAEKALGVITSMGDKLGK